MSTILDCPCPSCGTAYLIQRHTLEHYDTGELHCPKCGAVLVKWSGKLFYTLAVDPPRSPHEVNAPADE